MGYTNSSLVAFTRLSPNHSGQRTHSIDRISPHCVVGQCTAEGLGEWFAASSTQASSNYGIDKNGRVGLYVEEKNRSWCTSSNANDQRAITIECASGTAEPYEMYDVVYQSLIKLCTDICKRNGKKKLLWFADKDKSLNYEPASDEMIITVHRWFANKSCPGNWLYARLGDLASKVTSALGGTTTSTPATTTQSTTTTNKLPAVPFTAEVIIDDLNYRSSGSMNGSVLGQTGKGVFTIVEVKDGWGRLKSGAGWIYLENPSYVTIKGAATTTQPAQTTTQTTTTSGTQATSFKNMTEAAAAEAIGKLCKTDMAKSGILASVSAAQFILESGYGKSELAQNANNCFGMKCTLSGNTWSGSTWDGTSKYTKQTKEEYTVGNITTITADFRKYKCVEDSVADHSAYLLGAMNGSNKRYAGLKGEKDYKKAIQIIKDGGYATSSTYVSNVCSIIEKYNLTKFDGVASATPSTGTNDQNGGVNMSVNSIIENATTWMENTAKDNSHGYDQAYRWGQKGDYDCSAAVITAWQNAGVPVKTNGASYTGNMLSVFKKCGFQDVTSSINLSNGSGLKRGDVLLNTSHHTAMYCGNGQEVEASINEKGGITGGTPGDQTGKEFLIRAYRNYPWTNVLRYTGGATVAVTPTVVTSELKKGSTGDAVKTLQKNLNTIMNAGLEVDGSFGNLTYNAVVAFQKKYGLTVDGVVGSKTQAKISELLKPATTTSKAKVDDAASYDKSLAGTYSVTADALNVRAGAGTSKNILTTIPNGTKVKNYGYYTTVSGTKWLYIQFTYKNVTYTGFASGKYLKK